MKKYLSLFAWLPFLMQCSGSEQSKVQNAPSCAGWGEKPEIGIYGELDPGNTSNPRRYAVSLRDQACKKRWVEVKGCGPEAIQTLFGFATTTPRSLTNDEMQQFDQDATTLPSLSCTSDIEPLRDSQQRPMAVHIVDGKNGYRALRIENTVNPRPTYAFVPNECFTLGRKLNASHWAAQLEHPEDAIEKPYIPGADDLALHLGCAHEKAPSVGKEGWNFARVYLDDERTIYSLRYVSKEVDRTIHMLIYSIDGYIPEEFTPELSQAFEAQMASRLGIGVTDIANEALGSPDESTLFMDYCLNNCSGYKPQPFDGLAQDLLIESAGDSRYHLKALSNPFLEEGRFAELTGKRAFEFARCDTAEDDLALRLGFQSISEPLDTWENRLRKGAESSNDLRILKIPCFKKKPLCVRSIPAGTNLSSSMSGTPGSVSSYINKTSTCSRASELELHLEGDAEVQGNAFTIGNSSQTQFSKIILSGNPGAKIRLNIDCTKITCVGQTFAALQIVPNTTVELRGLRFITSHDPAKVKTIAVKSLGTGTMATPLYLNGITVGNEVPSEPDFNTGLWLDDTTTYAAASKFQAAYEGIHATRGQLSLIGRKLTGQVPPDDSVSVVIRQMTDKTVRTPSLDLLRALKLTDVRTFLFATRINASTGMELGSSTSGVGLTNAWYVDFNNTYLPYKNYAVAVLTKGPHVGTFSFPWIHDVTRLVNFAGSRTEKPRLDFRGIVEDSFVMDRELPIENAAQGYFNQVLGSDQDICRNPDDEEQCIL